MSETTTMMRKTEVLEWPVEMIVRSRFQQRTHFDEEALAELAESVRAHGVIQPLIVRRPDDKVATVELVAGERRWRASRAAGLETVPVIMRELSDVDAEEIVLIENLQREDLTPLEESRSFAALKSLEDEEGRPRYSDELLAERTGKSVGYIRRSLALLRVPERLQAAVEDGVVAASTAALVGSIHSADRREDAAREILEPAEQEIPLNFLQTQQLIREHYLVRIRKGCGFNPKDADLVPVVLDPGSGERAYGGSCDDCPHRSGNCREVQEDLAAAGGAGGGSSKGLDANLCTRPSCFQLKLAAVWKREKVKAREKGLATIEGAEARRVFSGWHGTIPYDSRYADVADKPEFNDLRMYTEESWGELMKGLEGIDRVIAQHPDSGKVHTLVIRKEAAKVIKAALRERESGGADGASSGSASESGAGPAEGSGSGDASAVKERAKRAEVKREERLEAATAMEAMAQLMEAIRAREVVDMDVWQLVTEQALHECGNDGLLWLAKLLEVPKPGKGALGRDYLPGIMEHIEEVTEEEPMAWLAFVMAALLASDVKIYGVNTERFQVAVKELGVSMASARRRAEAREGNRNGARAEARRGGADEGVVEPAEVIGRDGRNAQGHHVPNSQGNYRKVEMACSILDAERDLCCAISLAECPDGWRWGFLRLRSGEVEQSRPAVKSDPAYLLREDALDDAMRQAMDWHLLHGADDEWLERLEAERRKLTGKVEAEASPSPAAAGASVDTSIEVVPVPEGADPEVAAANAEYERRRNVVGEAVSMAMIEKEMGLPKKKLADFRSNAKRLAKRRG